MIEQSWRNDDKVLYLRVANEVDNVDIERLRKMRVLYDHEQLAEYFKPEKKFNDFIKKIFNILEKEVRALPKELEGINKEKVIILGWKLIK